MLCDWDATDCVARLWGWRYRRTWLHYSHAFRRGQKERLGVLSRCTRCQRYWVFTWLRFCSIAIWRPYYYCSARYLRAMWKWPMAAYIDKGSCSIATDTPRRGVCIFSRRIRPSIVLVKPCVYICALIYVDRALCDNK